jgi:hypothetical protein
VRLALEVHADVESPFVGKPLSGCHEDAVLFFDDVMK